MLTPTERTPVYTPPTTTPSADPVYVPPGRLLAARDGRPLTTIVSTGAVVCLWDAISGAGGMAHFLLPEVGSAPPAPRFGDVALKTLVEQLMKLGAPEKRLRARVFGGIAPPVATTGGHLGDRNIEAALAFLKARFISLVEKQAGGTGALKIIFTPTSGAATVVRVGLN